MALFGKKKTVEPTAPQLNAKDEIQVVGGDADETGNEAGGGGQVIDFDAITDELGDDGGQDTFGNGTLDLSKPAGGEIDPFATDASFEAGTAKADDNGLDFDAVFDDGTPAVATSAVTPQTNENPFGDGPDSTPIGAIAIEPVSDSNAPPLTYTAPLLTSDAVATAGAPAARKSFPLPMLLGAIGLLIALGAVGYLVTRGGSETEEEPIVATNPALRAPRPGGSDPMRAPGATANAVNPGIAVDGVPIAPGAIMQTAPLSSGARPTVPLTPGLLKQLKDLWKKGAAAKQKGDIAGARAAWMKMLQLRPNHPRVQSAIDKLPPA